jgi:hypothetical protein
LVHAQSKILFSGAVFRSGIPHKLYRFVILPETCNHDKIKPENHFEKRK